MPRSDISDPAGGSNEDWINEVEARRFNGALEGYLIARIDDGRRHGSRCRGGLYQPFVFLMRPRLWNWLHRVHAS